MSIPEFCRRIVEAPWFSRFIIGVIVFAGILVGIETSPSLVTRHGVLIDLLNNAVLFCVAASIRMHMRHMVVEGELPPYHVGLYYLLLLGGRIWGRFRAELRWLLVPSRTGASVEAVAV